MGRVEASGVLGDGTVERVEDPAIIADVCGPGPARDHGDGTPNPLILQALGTKRAGAAAARAKQNANMQAVTHDSSDHDRTARM